MKEKQNLSRGISDRKAKMPGIRDEDKVDSTEAQLEAQIELANMLRVYRSMRTDRRSYIEDTENTVRKQKMAIEALTKENEELESMIQVAKSRQNEIQDQQNVQTIVELLDREKQVHEEIRGEKEAVAQVEEKVVFMQYSINDLCKNMKKMGVSKDVYHDKYVSSIKLTRVMENRLDEMTKKFSIALTGNSKLREHISHIDGQKARFLDILRRLQVEISEGKKEISRISEMAAAHYSSRDEAQHRMASMRERAERDLAIFNAEVKDLVRVLAHDRKLRDFMKTKAEDRVSVLENELLSRTVKKMEAQMKGLSHEANKYEELFEQIKEATGIEDTNTLVDSFIEKEDHNFALFNYINNMNTEIENLQDEIKILKEEIELIKMEGVENDVRRKEILRELEEKMANVTEESSSVRKHYKLCRRLLEQLKPRIESLFNSTKCNRTAITDLLGGGVTVDDNNVLQYLGLVEQKCNEILQVKAMFKVKAAAEETVEVSIDGLQGVGPQPAHANLSIVPPPIEDDCDQPWNVNDAKPLTVEELQGLIMQGNVRVGTNKGAGVTKLQGKRKRV